MTNFAAPDAGFAERVRSSFARQGLMGLIGARLARVDPGVVDIELIADGIAANVLTMAFE